MKALEILNKLKNKMLNFTSIDVENATIEIEAMQEHNREWFLKIIQLTKQRDEAIAELEALQQPKSCKWEQCNTEFDTSYEGTCGAKWTIEHGTPKQNHMNFCPQCGGKLIQIEPKEQ